MDLTVDEAQRRWEQGAVLLDVRTDEEYRGAHIPGSVHIPLDQLRSRYQELDPEAETLVICAHGVRSAACADWLARQGFTAVANIRHGLSAWSGPLSQ